MNSSKSWTLKIRDDVYKVLAKFPGDDRKRVVRVLESLPTNPLVGDIQRMKGEKNSWRRRVGAYRIFYELIPEERVVYVSRVERRTSSTY